MWVKLDSCFCYYSGYVRDVYINYVFSSIRIDVLLPFFCVVQY